MNDKSLTIRPNAVKRSSESKEFPGFRKMMYKDLSPEFQRFSTTTAYVVHLSLLAIVSLTLWILSFEDEQSDIVQHFKQVQPIKTFNSHDEETFWIESEDDTQFSLQMDNFTEILIEKEKAEEVSHQSRNTSLEAFHLLMKDLQSRRNDGIGMKLNYFAELCAKLKVLGLDKDSYAYKLSAGSCGWGYDYRTNFTEHDNPWRIAFYGEAFSHFVTKLSGCPNIGCTLFPNCKFIHTTELHDATSSNVVLVFQTQAGRVIKSLPEKGMGGKELYKVLYWREASKTHVSIKAQSQYNFEMGVHYTSSVLNPSFFKTPFVYLTMSFPPHLPKR